MVALFQQGFTLYSLTLKAVGDKRGIQILCSGFLRETSYQMRNPTYPCVAGAYTLQTFSNIALSPLQGEIVLLGPELYSHNPRVTKLLILVTCICPGLCHNSATCINLDCPKNTRMGRLLSRGSRGNLDKHHFKATS